MQFSKYGTQEWGLMIACAVIWSGSFILMKKGLTAYTPQQVACMRIAFTMFLFLPFLPRVFATLHKKDWLPLASVGLLGNTIPPFLFTAAQTHLNSATAGILNALTPLFTLIMGLIFFKYVFSRNKFMGILLGLLGAVLLIIHTAPAGTGQSSNYFYGIFIVIATMCYGTSANIVKTYCQHVPPVLISTVSFCTWGFLALAYLFSSDVVERFQTQPTALMALGSVATLALLGTAIATILFYRLMQRTDVLFASTVTYLMPIMAVVWGILDGEAVDWSYFVGIGLILGGVYLVQKPVRSEVADIAQVKN